MAIYHLHMQAISRLGGRNGRSAVACAAYRAGQALQDQKTGEIKDYTYRQGVQQTFILAPEGVPEWVHDREELWNHVESSETRINSRLAREIDIALPRELDAQQRAELVREYVRTEFVQQGMVADVALHTSPSKANNYHAHIMLTTREITEEGFGKKVREWDRVELLEHAREGWAHTVNRHLERAGIETSIDHRSLEAQGLEALKRGDYESAIELCRMPQSHRGAIATNIERHARGTSEKLEETRKERLTELAVYREMRKEAQELLELARASESQMPKHSQVEIDELEGKLVRLVAERREVSIDLHDWQHKHELENQKTKREEQAKIQNAPEAKRGLSAVAPLEQERVDWKSFSEQSLQIERAWNKAVSAQRESALQQLAKRQQPDVDRLNSVEKRYNAFLEQKNETEQEAKSVFAIFRRSAMLEEVKRLESVMDNLKETYQEIKVKILSEHNPYVLQGEQEQLASKAQPELFERRQAHIQLGRELAEKERTLERQRGRDDGVWRGPQDGISGPQHGPGAYNPARDHKHDQEIER